MTQVKRKPDFEIREHKAQRMCEEKRSESFKLEEWSA